MALFEPLGVKPEFLGHLDKLLGSVRVLDGTRQSFGSERLVAVVIGLGHVSTFLIRYKLRQKGSITVMRTVAGPALDPFGQMGRHGEREE